MSDISSISSAFQANVFRPSTIPGSSADIAQTGGLSESEQRAQSGEQRQSEAVTTGTQSNVTTGGGSGGGSGGRGSVVDFYA